MQPFHMHRADQAFGCSGMYLYLMQYTIKLLWRGTGCPLTSEQRYVCRFAMKQLFELVKCIPFFSSG